jgi:hypothetical protein
MATTKTSQSSLNQLLKTERVSYLQATEAHTLTYLIVPRRQVLIQDSKRTIQEDSRRYGRVWRA